MTSFMRNALLGAAGVVAMSLSANAAGTTTDTTQLKSTTAPELIKEARGPGVHSFRSENPGGAGFKKKKKKKK